MMEVIKERIRKTLLEVANKCHKKDRGDSFAIEINEMLELYKTVKIELQNINEDISLYRYKTLNEYANEEVKNQHIYMNKPSRFDDLFDANCVTDISVIDSDLAPRFNALYISKLIEESDFYKDADNKERKSTNGWDNYYESINSNVDKLVRIASLSQENENIPLWYYYANEHKGICIEYSLKEIACRLRDNEYIMPVLYTDNYFMYNPATTYADAECAMTLQANAIVKHNDWKFEKEWRIVQFGNERFNDYTDEIPIESITFGLNTDDSDIRKLMGINQATDYYKLKRTCYGFKRKKL